VFMNVLDDLGQRVAMAGRAAAAQPASKKARGAG